MIGVDRLDSLFSRFGGLTIGLVGDLFLDRYLEIDPQLSERSIETGLEAYQVTRVRNHPGALGTILSNLTALGVGRLVPVTVIGDDGQAYDLMQALAPLPVDTAHILQDASRMTPTYTKPLRRGGDGKWHELNRIDLRNRSPLAPALERRLEQHLTGVFESTDGLIVLDQVNEDGWGVVTPALRDFLAGLAARKPDKLMFVDSRAHIRQFACGILKPNEVECRAALSAMGMVVPDDVAAMAQELADHSGRSLFCTAGQRGIFVVEPGGRPEHVPAVVVEGPIDIVGAGDSATSGIVASLLAGASRVEAAAVGNLVASITIQQLGTTGTATPQQVRARLGEL